MGLKKINHTQISNEFLDEIMCTLDGSAVKVFLAISRKTIGWHKTVDYISDTQIQKITGLSRDGVRSGIKKLAEKNIVKVERGKIKGRPTKYTIDYGEEKPPQNQNGGVLSNPISSFLGGKNHPTKESNFKEINIYTHWNSKSIIEHRNHTNDIKRAVMTALSKFEKDDILKAIDNYAAILADQNKYYWSHKWPLKHFLQRGLDRFVDEADPLNNFKRKGSPGSTPKPTRDENYYKSGKYF